MTATIEQGSDELDAILLTFSKECPALSFKEIGEWTARHPKYAVEINEHAAIAIMGALTDAYEDEPLPELTEEQLLEGFDRTLAMLDALEQQDPDTLSDLATAAGIDFSKLAEATGMYEVVLDKLDVGLITAPVTGRLRGRLAEALKISPDAVDKAIVAIAQEPLSAAARATTQPTFNRQSYEDALRMAGMSEDDVNFWLRDD